MDKKTMKMPAFTAEAALYQTRANYFVMTTGAATDATQVVPQFKKRRLPPGLCGKACRQCRRIGDGWCDICGQCFDD